MVLKRKIPWTYFHKSTLITQLFPPLIFVEFYIGVEWNPYIVLVKKVGELHQFFIIKKNNNLIEITELLNVKSEI